MQRKPKILLKKIFRLMQAENTGYLFPIAEKSASKTLQKSAQKKLNIIEDLRGEMIP